MAEDTFDILGLTSDHSIDIQTTYLGNVHYVLSPAGVEIRETTKRFDHDPTPEKGEERGFHGRWVPLNKAQHDELVSLIAAHGENPSEERTQRLREALHQYR